MSLYKIEFLYDEYSIFRFYNRGNNSFYIQYSYSDYNSYLMFPAQDSANFSGLRYISVVQNDIVCFYFSFAHDPDSYLQSKFYYLDKNGDFQSGLFENQKSYSLEISDTPSSGLSQLTVQGNNLSSVSYNNQNYTTFPATLSLDNSVTTLTANGRVSSQRIN